MSKSKNRKRGSIDEPNRREEKAREGKERKGIRKGAQGERKERNYTQKNKIKDRKERERGAGQRRLGGKLKDGINKTKNQGKKP